MKGLVVHQIHIFSSSKGGVGKTILLYCLWQYLRERQSRGEKIRIIVLDVNHTEHDSYSIFTDNGQGEKGKPTEPYEIPQKFMPEQVLDYDATSYIEYRNGGNWAVMRLRTPYEMMGTALDFWYHLMRVFTNSIRPDEKLYLLVDTNSHVLNSWAKDATTKATTIQKDIKTLLSNVHKQYSFQTHSWFIWNLKSVLKAARMGTNQSTRGAEVQPDMLTPLLRGYERDFMRSHDGLHNMIHVFNPSAFMPDLSLPEVEQHLSDFQILATKFREFFTLNPQTRAIEIPEEIPFPGLAEIHKMNVGADPVSVQELTELMNEAYANTNPNTQTFFEKFHSVLSRRDSNPVGSRPPNIFAIPAYYKNLQGFVDRAFVNQNNSAYLKEVTKYIYRDLKKFMDR